MSTTFVCYANQKKRGVVKPCEPVDQHFIALHTNVNQDVGNITLKKNDIKDLLKGSARTKAEGPDEISNWVLEECAEELCSSLSFMFQSSVSQGRMPDALETALHFYIRAPTNKTL